MSSKRAILIFLSIGSSLLYCQDKQLISSLNILTKSQNDKALVAVKRAKTESNDKKTFLEQVFSNDNDTSNVLVQQPRFLCKTCGAIRASSRSLEEHIETEHKGILFTCKECGDFWKSSSGLRSHKEKCTGQKLQDKEKIYYCKGCSEGFPDLSSYFYHFRKTKSCKNERSPCPYYCSKTYQDLPSLKGHVRKVHEIKVKCCDMKFNTKNDYDKHLYDKHSKGKFKCTLSECYRVFNKNSEIARHILRMHPGVCYVCQQEFPSFDELQRHLESKHNILKSKCPNCNVVYKNSHVCLKDKISSTSSSCKQIPNNSSSGNEDQNGQYPCQKGCSESFPSPEKRINHERKKHPYSNFICSDCKKTFANRVSFTGHQCLASNTQGSDLNNNNENKELSFQSRQQGPVLDQGIGSVRLKPGISTVVTGIALLQKALYTCNLCGESYSNRNFLKDHLQVDHQGIYFFCKYCEKSLNTSDGLSKHEKKCDKKDSLIGDKKYECKHCSESFFYFSTFISHLSSLHKTETSFVCPLSFCSNTFSKIKYVGRHVREVHEKQTTCCGLIFTTNEEYKKHRQAVHAKGLKFQCSLCQNQTKFYKKNDMNSHIINFHKQCYVCNKAILNNEFEKHLESEHQINKKVCEKCGKLYKKSHDCSKNYVTCSTCGKEILKGRLFQHKEKEHKNKQFPCQRESCNEIFDTRGERDAHERSAHTAKDFVCSLCKGKFYHRQDFNDHVEFCGKIQKNTKNPLGNKVLQPKSNAHSTSNTQKTNLNNNNAKENPKGQVESVLKITGILGPKKH